ncbi:hypothetical protein NDU88_000787 [Pleurodeles waltl]|uniref:Fucolectin tachylectin-4 pentraxin-1 domain-containing protein n=1 Tax=Pleurodeles waltl TaxID=8319 RepID=A0AAV7Q535_PLEWA|nr:hypothetical protein NDU88_000787 [Pleurodeles waltl]
MRTRQHVNHVLTQNGAFILHRTGTLCGSVQPLPSEAEVPSPYPEVLSAPSPKGGERSKIFNHLPAALQLLSAGLSKLSAHLGTMAGLLVVLLFCGALPSVRGSTLLPASVNVAPQGYATQSTTFNFEGFAKNAISGDLLSDYLSGHCSRTAYEVSPWWRVDLGQSYEVVSVAVTNRGDCCGEQLNGAEIRIGNSLENHGIDNPRCATIQSLGTGATQSYACSGMSGRYVTVVIPGRAEYLSLCEVQVFALPKWDQRLVLKATTLLQSKNDIFKCPWSRAQMLKQLSFLLDQTIVPAASNLSLVGYRREEHTGV